MQNKIKIDLIIDSDLIHYIDLFSFLQKPVRSTTSSGRMGWRPPTTNNWSNPIMIGAEHNRVGVFSEMGFLYRKRNRIAVCHAAKVFGKTFYVIGVTFITKK